MDKNFAPDYYPAGTKVIFEDGTNDILQYTFYLLPGNYYLGKKIVAIGTSDAEAQQRRIAEAGAEIGRRAAEQVERKRATEERQRAKDAEIERVYREVAERKVAEQEEMRIWEAGAEERAIAAERLAERRRIEEARPHDKNNPAPRNDQGRPYERAGNPLYWGGRRSRRGRKSKKSKKSRSKKRRSNRRRRR
jgi:hypothetical protein